MISMKTLNPKPYLIVKIIYDRRYSYTGGQSYGPQNQLRLGYNRQIQGYEETYTPEAINWLPYYCSKEQSYVPCIDSYESNNFSMASNYSHGKSYAPLETLVPLESYHGHSAYLDHTWYDHAGKQYFASSNSSDFKHLHVCLF